MKRMIAIILALAMLLSLCICFTACGDNDSAYYVADNDDDDDDDDDNGNNSNNDDNKDDPPISTREKLTMATNVFPPYVYEEDGAYFGIDVEIAEAIAKKLDMELVITEMEFGVVLTNVAEGRYNIGMTGITVNTDRKQTLDFSETYATNTQVILVRDGSSIHTLDDIYYYDYDGNPVSLKDPSIRVGVQENTTGDIYASDSVDNWGFNELNADDSIKTDRVRRFATYADAVMALSTGSVDCVILDNVIAESLLEIVSGVHMLDVGNEYAVEDYAVCVKKGNAELLSRINQALRELKEDGSIDRIIAKYIR